MLTCQICGYQHPSMIHFKHIRDHGLSTDEYKLKYPNSPMRIQSSEVRAKSSASKAGKVSPLKGRQLTEEHKSKLAKAAKTGYESGRVIHWNTGNVTSIEVREKIAKGNTSCLNRGNVKQRSKKHLRMEDGAAQYGCLLIEIDEYTSMAKAKCSTCDHVFSFTHQIFYPSRLAITKKLCPVCQPRETFSSKSEKELLEFIKSICSENVIANDREVLGGKEIDVFIPSLKLGFEFTGLYWHAEKQNPEKKHLLWKTQFAKKRGVKLITVFEDEWLNKRSIVESRIRGMLNANETKFNARSLDIREVQPKMVTNFLNSNHIQGKDAATIKLGLFDGEELIMLTTFKKSNVVKGGDGKSWELSRLCSKLNCRVRGGASKLIKHFQDEFNKENLPLLSYADTRWSTGDLYETLGFTFAGASSPSYWYMSDYKIRVHRSTLMKHRLVKCDDDKLLTEWDLAQRSGYDRIWDCGTTKWILNK